MNDEEPLSSTSTSSAPPVLLRPRREPFEHGLLPLPKLIFTDGTQSLSSVKQKLLLLLSTTPSPQKVSVAALADALQIGPDLASLVLQTLHSVLPNEGKEEHEDDSSVDLHDLLLFLYIQTYKRLLPRTHKDSVAVADVWPSTSAFDGYLSALSPIQLVRSNSRKFMPSQADEEAHQLSYLQKHMANLLALLADPVEGESDESLVLTQERFEHIGLLLQLGEKGCEGSHLSQAAPFFANSDPDMPAAPVPTSQVQEWISQNIVASLEHIAEKASSKENGPQDVDVIMPDVCTTQNQTAVQSGSHSRSPTFVEGVSKASVVKQASDIKGSSIKVLNCHDSVIYILAPLRYATIYGCSDATIILGAVGKSVRVEHCERVQIIAASKRICIANCRECIFYLGVNQRPLILGDNHKLQVAPYNTFYPQLKDQLNKVHIDPTISRWNEPLVLGLVDPHDSLSHPAGVSDVQAESPACLDPDSFTNFLIPNWFGGESSEPTKDNPFPLPENYIESLKKHHLTLNDIQQAIQDLQVEDNKKRELASALHVHFKEWLYASGNIRQLYCLQGD